MYQYSKIAGDLHGIVKAQLPAKGEPRSIFDPDIGYRYAPSLAVRHDDLSFPVEWRTNSHGLIARDEFPIDKPPGVFRIGLVGDSFTADVTNTVRWGDVMEDALNASDAGAG